MEGLKTDLYERTRAFFREYVAAHLEKDNFFQSTGKSYLYLAKEEPHLYEFYFLKKSPNRICSSLEELYQQECSLSVAEHLAQELSISLGIVLSIGQMTGMVVSFVILGIIALFLNYRLLKYAK